MSNSNPWGRFFWNDWENDPALRLSSLAAQGLWMRMLCIAAKSEPVGYLTIAGRTLNLDDISTLIGRPVTEIAPLIDELDHNGVFSRDAKGRIYNRRMLRDVKNLSVARKNGKNGGNPSLSNKNENSRPVNPPLKPSLIAQKPVPISTSKLASKNACEEEMLPSPWQDYAEAKGIPNEQIFKSWRKFKEMTSFPYELLRWQAWCDREKINNSASYA